MILVSLKKKCWLGCGVLDQSIGAMGDDVGCETLNEVNAKDKKFSVGSDSNRPAY